MSLNCEAKLEPVGSNVWRARKLLAGACVLLLPLVLGSLLAACERDGSEPTAFDNDQSDTSIATKNTALSLAGSIEVIDYLGRRVVLSAPASRIVALAPHIVENLYSAGMGSAIVATVNYADYPEPARLLPRIGGFTNFSLESIVAHQPDLVVAWASGSKNFGALLSRLEQLGIAVYADDPRSLEDIGRSITDFAKLGGVDISIDDKLTKYSNSLEQLRYQSSNDDLSGHLPVSVFYEIWHQPLQTLNGKHLVSAAIALCGGKNIFDDALTLAPKVNIESVLARDPELIVSGASNNAVSDASIVGGSDSGNNVHDNAENAAGNGSVTSAWRDEWRRWPTLRAVKSNQLYHIQGDLLSRHSLRIADGIALLCEFTDNARRARASGSLTGTPVNRAATKPLAPGTEP